MVGRWMWAPLAVTLWTVVGCGGGAGTSGSTDALADAAAFVDDVIESADGLAPRADADAASASLWTADVETPEDVDAATPDDVEAAEDGSPVAHEDAVSEDTSPPTDTFEPSEDTFEPNEDSFEPSEDTFVPAEDTFEPSEDTFVPAEDSLEPSEDTFEPTDTAPGPDADDAVTASSPGWTGVRQWGLATDDSAEGVAVDDLGTIYVSGWKWGGLEYVGTIDAFDADGAPLWQVVREGVYDHMTRKADYSPASDLVYVAEQSKLVENSNAQFAILAALDPTDGSETWSTVVDFLDGASDFTVGSRAVVAPAGYVYLTGSYKRLASTGWEVGSFLARYDDLDPMHPGGVVDELGPYPYTAGGYGDTHLTNVLPLDDGGVMALAQTPNAVDGESVFGASDGLVRRYDADGALLWSRRYGTPGNDYLTAIARLPDGRVAVGGGTEGVLGEASAGGRDAVVLLLDPVHGAVIDVWQFGTPGGDHVLALEAASDGTLFVLGAENLFGSGAAQTANGFVRRINAKSGDALWSTPIAVAGSGYVWPMAMTPVGPDVMVVGRVRGALGGQAYSGGLDAFALRVTGDGAIP